MSESRKHTGRLYLIFVFLVISHGTLFFLIRNLQNQEKRLREDLEVALAEVRRLQEEDGSRGSRTVSLLSPHSSKSAATPDFQPKKDKKEPRQPTPGKPSPVMNGSGKIVGPLGKSLGVSDSQVERTQLALDNIRQKVENFLVDRAEVNVDAKGTITVQLRPYDGSGFYDQLANELSTILGDEKAAQFLAQNRFQIDRAMSAFGAEHRTVVLSKEAGEDGISRVDLFDRRAQQGVGSERRVVIPKDQFLKEYNFLVRKLPPNF